MGAKRANPARGEAPGLGNVVHGQAIDCRVDITAIRARQTHWLITRFHVRAVVAPAIASLAFEEARR